MSKIFMEKIIKRLRVRYLYLLVRLRGLFLSHWQLLWMPVMSSKSSFDPIKLRFLSIRGCIKMFISDNFSTFRSDEVSKFTLLHNIDWEFILLLSPWWEVFMRDSEQLKTLLRKILGRDIRIIHHLNSGRMYVEFITFLIRLHRRKLLTNNSISSFIRTKFTRTFF